MKNDDLIRRLCEASEGSAELSAEVWTALTGVEHTCFSVSVYRRGAPLNELPVPCLTTSLSAAWEEARKRGFYIAIEGPTNTDTFDAEVMLDPANPAFAYARTPALALCAAILAAEGER